MVPFSSSISQASKPFELIHTDIWGPMLLMSSKNCLKYYIHFLDDFNKYTCKFPPKNNCDSLSTFMQFKAMVEKQFNTAIKIIHNDPGGEYQAFSVNIKPSHLLPDNKESFINSHAQSPLPKIEEYKENTTGIPLKLALQSQHKLKCHYHCYSYDITNCLPTSTLHNISPFLYPIKKQHDYKLVHPFGCATYPCLTP